TGFPIAKIAAKLAVGYTLDELDNDITGVTPASFEPTIDYVVTKIPRFAFEKFPGAEPVLTTAMKSVGEAMAIGRTFQESLQKALRSLETGLSGLDEYEVEGIGQGDDLNAIRKALGTPTPDRILAIAQAFRMGLSVDDVHSYCQVDPWFLEQIEELMQLEKKVSENGLPTVPEDWQFLKSRGFSDHRLGELTGKTENDVSAARRAAGVRPVFKRIDTVAAEFEARTPYMYSTYEYAYGDTGAPQCEAAPTANEKIVILGGGPNRIGQGIEFDYCCCHAAFALNDDGYETIMVNCNPETVSTDYDTSDRLYFEPLTSEDVLELLRVEQEAGGLKGVIVQFGGQTPLKLANDLEAAGIPILGTSPDAIDLAEDRDRFQKLVQELELKQPRNGIAASGERAIEIAEEVGYPVVIRPSYVLGGRAMEIVHDRSQLERYIKEAVVVSGKSPVLIDGYLQDAIEVDVDALADGDEVFVAGIMEHIEEAGIHSGDSACSLPPYSLSDEIIAELKRQTTQLAKALKVVGLMNVQFAVKEQDIYLIEVNPRASRTVPFVAKTVGFPVAKVAARLMAGQKLKDMGLSDKPLKHIAVKEAVFPFARFPGVDILLGPEMRSTGEVMGLDTNFDRAFAKSQLGGGTTIPSGGTVFVSVKDRDKEAFVGPIKSLISAGFTVTATSGTARYLQEQGLAVTRVNKVLEGHPHILDAITNGDIQLVFNTTEGAQAIADSHSLRRAALTNKIPYYTTVAGARAAAGAILALGRTGLEVHALQSYN
ncbi:MAG: carbamoyl-phosphate synthase large subunit, partial [Alphaproteobacteria bacterium]